MDKLKIIKTTVFVLTFLLIFGSLSLLGLIYKKSQSKNNFETTISTLNQPQGSEIKQINSSNENIHIVISGGGIADRVISINPTNNKIISIFSLN